MHFSVTKEVGWEADDESEEPRSPRTRQPSRIVKKQYRFVLDFGRGTPWTGDGGFKAAGARAGRQRNRVGSEKYENNITTQKHCCCLCGKVRSDYYHYQHPIQRGKQPTPSLCSGCNYDRKMRLADRHRHVTRLQPGVDDRQWCANCGVLRSARYHEMYASGSLPPWSEICRKCTAIAEEDGRRELRRLRSDDWDLTNHHLLHNSYCRQDRPSGHKRNLCRGKAGDAAALLSASANGISDDDSRKHGKHSAFFANLDDSPSFPGCPDGGSEAPRVPSSNGKAVIGNAGTPNSEPTAAKLGEMEEAFPPAAVGEAPHMHTQRALTGAPASLPSQHYHNPSSSYEAQQLPSKNHQPTIAPPEGKQQPQAHPERRDPRHHDLEEKASKPASSQPGLQHPKSTPNPAEPAGPRGMGISDMYWASEDGMREHEGQEQAFLGAFFFPFPDLLHGHDFRHGCPASSSSSYGFGSHPFACSSGADAFHHGVYASFSTREDTTTTTPVWEVDSDEAEEIEKHRGSLVAQFAARL